MSDAIQSEYLLRLIDNARHLAGGPDGLLTAEKLILTAIGELKHWRGMSDECKHPEMLGFEKLLQNEEIDLNRAEKWLIRFIDDQKEISPDDAIYLHKKIIETRRMAADLDTPFLTADALLLAILHDPTAALRTCFAVSRKGAVGEEEGQDKEDAELSPRGLRGPTSLIEAIRKAKENHEVVWKAKPEEEKESREAVEKAMRDLFEDFDLNEEDDGELPALDEKAELPRDKIHDLVEFVKKMRAELLEKVLGQDEAVSVFVNGYFQGELASMLESKRTRPKATFLFAGPPGVGKTYLAETAAGLLELPFKRFDMSEYSDKEATIQLVGSDSVYQGSSPGLISDYVTKNPKCVLLFDEIEKAHVNTIHLFLQILDAGRLTDAKTKKEVLFKDVICIFTTNAGKKLYEESESEDLSGVSRKVILKALEKDINPQTQNPFFPPALCSRFASGNVVLFNHMSAPILRDIARKVITDQADDLREKFGIRTVLDKRIYTALLLAEGGESDARMISGRARSFFNEEFFELLRLVDSEKTETGIEQIEEIRFGMQLPENDPEICGLFEAQKEIEGLVFASEEDAQWCRENQAACSLLKTQSLEAGAEILRDHDVRFVLLDLDIPAVEDNGRFLNVEDIDSEARDFLWFVREKHAELPVYLLLGPEERISVEEQLSFRRIGVRGFLEVRGDQDEFAARISSICDDLHQQKNVADLARANKLVSFETGQRISADGKTADICLFDFELSTAVEAEDSENILSSISRPNVHFSDVVGAGGAKKELGFFLNYLKNPKKYVGSGLSTPKGVLLYGPPGTGKTLLAKAMAREADVTFLAAEGNQFLKKLVGEGPASVHDLFRRARKYAPSILFVDEIDAIAKKRTGSEFNGAREEILTAFLTEMDGFRSDPSRPVFVLAATNFDADPGKESGLDEALMRRFDRRIFVDLPNKEERILYLKRQFKDKPIFCVSDALIGNIAVRSTGMSLAALESVIELSLRTAIRKGDQKVTDEVFEDAFETFNSGEEKKWSPSELERTARHEAGHAFLSWASGDKPAYLTIVARSDHGGYMQFGDNESRMLYTKEELLARIRTALGGRAAEIVYYGEKDGVSTGARGDLAKATDIAERLTCSYGMDEEFGMAVVRLQREYSPDIRKAVNRILSGEMKKAIDMIAENRARIDRLVERLLSDNRLTGAEIDAILSEDGEN